MILVVDTETTGLIVKHLPMDDPSQPAIMQIGLELLDRELKVQDMVKLRVRLPHGKKVSAGAERTHGVSSIMGSRNGVSEMAALGVIAGLASQARYIVGFSAPFDRRVIECCLMRLQRKPTLITRPGLEWINLTIPAAAFCKLPSDHDSNTYAWPNLNKASAIILGEEPDLGPHDAMKDCVRARKIFLSLYEKGLIQISL